MPDKGAKKTPATARVGSASNKEWVCGDEWSWCRQSINHDHDDDDDKIFFYLQLQIAFNIIIMIIWLWLSLITNYNIIN